MDEAIEPNEAPARRRRLHPILRAVLWTVLGLFALIGITLVSIDTSAGHRLIVERLATLKIRTGLKIRIGRIDGSIWNHAVLRDVRLYDLKGQFFEAPEIRLDWHPLRWLDNRLDIDSLTAPAVALERLPKLHTRPNQPLLPAFDIRIGRLAVSRMMLGRGLVGRPAIARIEGRADIRDRRAMIVLAAASDKRDRLMLDMDAMPDGDRFRLAGRVDSPAGGALGGLFGTKRAIHAEVNGQGGWHAWDGHGSATVDGQSIADLALTAREGRYGLSGLLAPSPYLQGKAQRLTTPRIAVTGEATLANRRLDGHLGLVTPALSLGARGALDLSRSAFSNLIVDVALLDPKALFPNMSGHDIRLHVALDGAFRSAAFRYALTAPRLAFDATGFETVRIAGAGHIGRLPLPLPIKLQAAKVTGIGDVGGGILRNLSLDGTLAVDARQVNGSGLKLASDKLHGKLALHLDLVTGKFDVAVSGGLTRYFIPGLGIVDVDTTLTVVPTPDNRAAIVAGRATADVRRFDNAFLRSLAGGLPHLTTKLVRQPDGSITLSDLVLTGPAIRIAGSGLRRRDGSLKLDGTGKQAIYGAFRIALDGMIEHPRIDLLFEKPVPALGLRAVRLTLDPIPPGFAFKAAGDSYLGPFAGKGTIDTPPGGTTVIDIADLAVTGTHASGSLQALPAGLSGKLALSGGGIGGSFAIAPQGTLQRIDPHLSFAGATLAAATPITVRRGKLDGAILLDPAGTKLDITGSFGGLARGKLQLARLGLTTHLTGGSGTIGLTAIGSGARNFALTAHAALDPARVTVDLKGAVDGQPLAFDGPARLTAEGSGWRLAPITVGYGGGTAKVGALIGDDSYAFDAGLDRVPLALLDVINPNAQLAGSASGRVTYAGGPGRLPAGRADVTIHGLSRSGLVLSSQPIDLGLTAVLTPTGVAARAVAANNGKTIGRAQLRIAPLGAQGDIVTRLGQAPLFAQLRYAGPGDILWRLVGIRTIDLSGPLSIGADVAGTLDAPRIQGSVQTQAGRIEGATTGTIVQNIQATGRFDGSRLLLDKMSGTTPNGGTVTGHGAFDLSLSAGVGIDIALQTQNALLLNRDDIAATVSGPITIRSNGRDGIVAGDLTVSKARYRLGATAAAQVGRLNVLEINQGDDSVATAAPPTPWSLDVKARAANQLMVTGLGLDSEWKATLTLKGPVTNPAIGGKADLMRGTYEFAGRRFDLSRGIIRFTGDAPPDPILDITANANIQGLSASIRVTGTGLHPDIGFESTPALPEDELLSRLLFGTSITNLSAPEALQLAGAVAALRNNGGGNGLNLDPINAIRRVAHLDRLRVVPADVTTGQKTAIAAGKYIGRRFYVEVITDGAGYSATSAEFRVTRWLSVLSTISTIGRQSVNLKASKDY
jgi:translocation and assembly module TamB